jgi:hypothetical protein
LDKFHPDNSLHPYFQKATFNQRVILKKKKVERPLVTGLGDDAKA